VRRLPVLHVYAITDSSRGLRGTGLEEVELRAVGREPPFAVVSEHEELPPQFSEDDLWTHERVVEELMEGAAVLPLRIDGTVSDQETLQRILDERREEFEALLAGVRGAVELGVRAQLADAAEPEAAGEDEMEVGERGGPGTAYLLMRARHQRQAEDMTARIDEPLAALSRKSRQSSLGLRPGLFKAAYLVDRDRVDAFRARVDVLDSELGGGQVVCTGPWPPYSFSSEEST
jgi:Gas vesicle synthesis protein GvpL/GvpF